MKRLSSLALVIAACGVSGGELTTELAAVTYVVSAERIEVVGRDAPHADVDVGTTEPRLDILQIDVAASHPVYSDLPALGSPVRVVRDPLSYGATRPVLDDADLALVLVIPLLDPTRSGIPFSGRLVTLDAERALLRADLDAPDLDPLARVLASQGDPAENLAETIRGLNLRTRGEQTTSRQDQLIAIFEG